MFISTLFLCWFFFLQGDSFIYKFKFDVYLRNEGTLTFLDKSNLHEFEDLVYDSIYFRWAKRHDNSLRETSTKAFEFQ